MAKYILTLIFSFVIQLVIAQKPSFESTTVNCGTTAWNTPAKAVFKLTNKDGKQALIIKNVDPGCGCMSAEWPKRPVEKGAKAEITIVLDGKTLGHYDRYIEVFTNASQKPIRLRMKGIVSHDGKRDMSHLYPYQIDDIYLSTNNIEFPDVHAGDSTRTSFEIMNGGNEVYTPQLMHLPSYITAKAVPEMLARGRKGRIELTLHGDKMPSLGLNQTSIYLARFSGDHVATNNDLTVSAVLLPDMTEALSAAQQPRFEISTTELKLGKLGKKTKLKGKVTISNKGNATLNLNNIQAFNRAISVTLPKRELAPGQKIDMSVTVEAKYLGASKAQPRILLITNDPLHSKEVVNVKFEK